MAIKCFLIKETGKVQLALRRYASGSDCLVHGYHNAFVPLEEKADVDPDGIIQELNNDPIGEKYKELWPVKCDCGYEFTDQDIRQVFRSREYADDQGNLMTLKTAPAGAIWSATWLAEANEYRGPDGQSLVVRLPNGHDWNIDGRASNCDSPCKHCNVPYNAHGNNDSVGHYYEDSRPHKCWIRHGTPPDLHVDKNGVTCGASGGSIASGKEGTAEHYHGFLHNGCLT